MSSIVDKAGVSSLEPRAMSGHAVATGAAHRPLQEAPGGICARSGDRAEVRAGAVEEMLPRIVGTLLRNALTESEVRRVVRGDSTIISRALRLGLECGELVVTGAGRRGDPRRYGRAGGTQEASRDSSCAASEASGTRAEPGEPCGLCEERAWWWCGDWPTSGSGRWLCRACTSTSRGAA